MDDAFAVEEGDQQCFCKRLFSSRWEVGEHHAVNCRFDSGSNW